MTHCLNCDHCYSYNISVSFGRWCQIYNSRVTNPNNCYRGNLMSKQPRLALPNNTNETFHMFKTEGFPIFEPCLPMPCWVVLSGRSGSVDTPTEEECVGLFLLCLPFFLSFAAIFKSYENQFEDMTRSIQNRIPIGIHIIMRYMARRLYHSLGYRRGNLGCRRGNLLCRYGKFLACRSKSTAMYFFSLVFKMRMIWCCKNI